MKPLKDATAEKHREAESMPFNQRMAKGQLKKEEYLLYLVQLQAIFEVLEQNSLPHPGLNRLEAVKEDIYELINYYPSVSDLSVLGSTRKYTHYLERLSPEGRLPHIYLHYLAIFFGGKILKLNVPSKGSLYSFLEPEACVLSIRALQKDEWADEVNIGFSAFITILEELEESCFPRFHGKPKRIIQKSWVG